MVALSVAACGSQIASAQNTLTFFGEENVPPWSFTEKDQIRGIDCDLILEVGKRMNLQINIQLTPWKRMILAVQDGECDAGFTSFYIKEREEFAIYAQPPLHYSTYSVFVRKGGEFPFAAIQDLYGKTVGIVRGYKIGDEFVQAVAAGRIKTEEVTEKAMNMKKLDDGRIDCAISPLETTLLTLQELGLADKIAALPKPVAESKPLHLVFSKSGKNIADKPDFVKRFSTVLEEMKKDGTFTGIYDRYLKTGRKKPAE